MANDPLSSLTLLTNFLCMAISLWFAIYLLARSHANHLTFRAVIALLASAFYFNSTSTEIVNHSVDTYHMRSLAVIIALVAVHDLTHYLLPSPLRRKLYWVARGFVLLAVIITILHFSLPPAIDCDPRYHCPGDILSPWVIVESFQVLVSAAILYNLWQIKQSGGILQSRTFYLALLLSVSTIGYNFLGTTLNINLPRLVSNLLMLSALVLLAYSVTRHQTLVTFRKTTYDLPITLLTIAVITGIYILAAWQIGLSLTGYLLLSMLAVFTHSAYDFVREFLDRLFRRQERLIRRELMVLGRDTSLDKPLRRYLRRGLAILCHNLRASSGFIAIRKEDRFAVATSLHSLPVGTQFPPNQVILEEPAQPTSVLAKQVSWLAPAYAGGEQVAVVGIGAPKGQTIYSEEDIYWLEEIADQIGEIIFIHETLSTRQAIEPGDEAKEAASPTLRIIKTDELLSALAFKPDPELVRCVEDGFRNLHDYSKLGRSPLVSMFEIPGKDHIECGKRVQSRLIQILEKLRPHGESPSEPLPREWYSYTILHDAYVEEKPARDIMSKLYISEGTYYRTRRKALRGITRALLEMEAVA